MGNVILDGHYEKFVQKAKRNPKMRSIPTLDELQAHGFEITDLFFLIVPGGMQVNPETVNPDIFEDSVKRLFLIDSKVCEVCQKDKPIEEYRKRQGRGGRRSICMECEETVKADITDTIQNSLSKDQIHIIDGRTGKKRVYVAYEDVVRLVSEAHKMGRAENEFEVVSPKLEELISA